MMPDAEIAAWKRQRDVLAEVIEARSAEIVALIEQRDRAMKALRWAMPLAEIAMEDHRQRRLAAGHKFGTKRIGLYDDEVQQIEDARSALAG